MRFCARGFALPLLLAVLSVLSVLGAASFLMARLEVQSGENSLSAARALESAEAGLSEIIAWWDPIQYNQLIVGQTLAISARTLGRGGYTGRLTRLSPALFRVEANGWYTAAANIPIARRTLWSFARLMPQAPTIKAALTVVDSVNWDAGSLVSGGDTIPPGWGGSCIPDSSIAGLVTPPSARLNLGTCPGCMAGTPPLSVDSSVTAASLTSFGSGGYAGLAARASVLPLGILGTIAPRVSGTPPVCLVSDTLNWGEPLRSGPYAACGGYHRVIHSPGDLTLSGGRGQGILLVDGDLELGGGSEFFGLVVVLGTVRNGPGGGSIIGGLMASRVSLASIPGSTITIHYSACVLPTASRGSSQAIPLPYRSWAQSF